MPDGRAVTREAIGGYPDMPAEEDRVKGGDSDAFKRACVLFGIGEYLYGDEPAEPAEPRRDADPTSNGDGRGEPRNVPRDRISFPDARAFYGWLKDNGHLALAEEIAQPRGLPGTHRPLDTRADRRGHPGNPRTDAHRPLTTPRRPGPEPPGPEGRLGGQAAGASPAGDAARSDGSDASDWPMEEDRPTTKHFGVRGQALWGPGPSSLGSGAKHV